MIGAAERNGAGSRDYRGPGTWDPGTRNSWTQIGIHYTYTCKLHTGTTGMHYGMDYEILCTVDGTFVLTAFIPSTPSDIRRDPFTAGIKGVRATELIKYARDL